ncbi:efflux transporter periplasmic adaptor subunit [Echinicola strongylocentroti]|uniref:Efflux transporter periplasmic adaptor subunit n=2 Tax=Echinicola strongylocentroti TaxID=1795355 RepID=A0A2Z4ID92_9BACT|nr:efflux transporter periplasmic adaptor subunit [Echinicola strongylocentroti]
MLLLSGCDKETSNEEATVHEESEEGLHLTHQQVEVLQLDMDTVSHRIMSSLVEVNGVLEVPPQNEAAVTAYIGANVMNINVIEGDEVSEGKVLAYLSHPELIKMQTNYSQDWHRVNYLQKEYERQNTLYQEEVGSGRDVEKISSELAALRGSVSGQENQLKLLGMDPAAIRKGTIMERIPVKSPIAGYIKEVNIKTGQYVGPEHEMFEVVNIHHIHADLMVFEKDVNKVKVGQKVRFTVQTLPDEELLAEVYAVGKSFEEMPKAVHIHAEIENKKGLLIPGMYVKGQVITDDSTRLAVREGAVVMDGGRSYLFAAMRSSDQWNFEKVEIITESQDSGWTSVRFLAPEDKHKTYVMNNAYYLMAEMKKGEGGHHH